MIIGVDASRANLREKTGTEWYSFHIIRTMIRAHPEARFRLYTKEPLEPPLAALIDPKVESRVLRWQPRFLWSQLRLSVEMLFHAPTVLFIPAHTIPLIHPHRTVTTCHDVGFERYPELYGQKRIGPAGQILKFVLSMLVRLVTLGKYGATELDYHRFSMRLATRTAARIIVISDFTARELQHFYHVDPKRLRIIHQGCSAVTVTDNDVREALHLYHITIPFLLYIGRIERKKNILGLLKAHALLQHSLPGCPPLILVGKDGVGIEEIEAYRQTLPDPRLVVRLPWIPQAHVTALLRAATVFVFPSFYEGFGLPVLEAFAQRTPVVAARTSALPEVAGPAALFVDPTQPEDIARGIRRLLEHPEEQARLVDEGFRRLTEFSWEKTAEKTFQLLSQVAANE